VKRRDRDRQWTDSRESQPCGLLIHRSTGGGRVLLLQLQTAPQGRLTLPPAGIKCRVLITGFKIVNKYSVVCVPQKTKQEKIYISKVQTGVSH